VSRQALELAAALRGAYNAHEPAEAGALYAPAATHTDVALSRRATGAEDISRGLASFLRCFPDAHWDALEWIGDHGAAAMPYRLTGTLSAPMGPIEPAGQRLDLRGVLVVHAGDGAITATEDYWDGATFREQMNPS
jgi:steroid delta-isomerase-like uncharacterized protein